jgi:hypothetical protein
MAEYYQGSDLITRGMGMATAHVVGHCSVPAAGLVGGWVFARPSPR